MALLQCDCWLAHSLCEYIVSIVDNGGADITDDIKFWVLSEFYMDFF